eukprot:1136641-Pelagomonas_calceolata.AAC.6
MDTRMHAQPLSFIHLIVLQRRAALLWSYNCLLLTAPSFTKEHVDVYSGGTRVLQGWRFRAPKPNMRPTEFWGIRRDALTEILPTPEMAAMEEKYKTPFGFGIKLCAPVWRPYVIIAWGMGSWHGVWAHGMECKVMAWGMGSWHGVWAHGMDYKVVARGVGSWHGVWGHSSWRRAGSVPACVCCFATKGTS